MSEEERRRIAEKGGETVSRDREHMSEIGRKGGEARAEGRDDDRGGNQGGGSR
jgi:general stress protein YciG